MSHVYVCVCDVRACMCAWCVHTHVCFCAARMRNPCGRLQDGGHAACSMSTTLYVGGTWPCCMTRGQALRQACHWVVLQCTESTDMCKPFERSHGAVPHVLAGAWMTTVNRAVTDAPTEHALGNIGRHRQADVDVYVLFGRGVAASRGPVASADRASSGTLQSRHKTRLCSLLPASDS